MISVYQGVLGNSPGQKRIFLKAGKPVVDCGLEKALHFLVIQQISLPSSSVRSFPLARFSLPDTDDWEMPSETAISVTVMS